MKPVHRSLDELISIIDRLRSPQGCPWDRRQDPDTLKPYLLEECHEVLESIDEAMAGDADSLRRELGDLLMLLLFVVRFAEEQGWFSLNDSLEAVSRKLVRRHPAVFDEEEQNTEADQNRTWSRIKARERRERGTEFPSALDGIPKGLPALLAARRSSEKAAQVGFDWPSPAPVMEKVREEIEELAVELDGGGKERQRQELGDALLALTNLSRHLEIDPEDALKRADRRFGARFRRVEEVAREQGRELDGMSLEEMEELWQQAKRERG